MYEHTAQNIINNSSIYPFQKKKREELFKLEQEYAKHVKNRKKHFDNIRKENENNSEKIILGSDELPFNKIIKDATKGGGFSVQTFLKNMDNALDGKGKEIMEVLFSKDEIVLFRDYSNAVAKTLTPKDCYVLGKNIAILHKATKKLKLYRKNSLDVKWLMFLSLLFSTKVHLI